MDKDDDSMTLAQITAVNVCNKISGKGSRVRSL